MLTHLTNPRNLAVKLFLPHPHFFLSCSPSLHPRSSSQLGALSPNFPLSLSPLSPSLSLSPSSLPTLLSLSRSRKVKPPRRLMDENGIKMKAHFQIMKICGGRLGSWGEAAEVPTKLILKFMCVWLRQSPCVISTRGAKMENITKILIAFEGRKWNGGAFFFFSANSVHFV